jgi:acyl-CoA thioester hydrolase
MKPSLPPTEGIQKHYLKATTEQWFEYQVKVYPHHTDYGGIVWHGTYLTWLEESRVECLRSSGIEYADLVNLGYELPVIELSIRYHQPLRLGMDALLKTRMTELEGVRIHWKTKIQSLDGQTVFATARVTLVAIDSKKGKIMRQLPPAVKDALVKLYH